MAQLEERVAKIKIEGTLSQMNERLNHIETRFSQLETRLNQLFYAVITSWVTIIAAVIASLLVAVLKS
ncbi:TPA: hypothetical protein EYP12_00315 [Candidatus Bipolaricaulota bacterium]|nr:hypothetical protein [Candidatus Bipolaricaulota bacterium]